MMTIGINKISERAANRKMFDVCNSTIEIIRRAPHHEFCPSVYKKESKILEKDPKVENVRGKLTSKSVSE